MTTSSRWAQEYVQLLLSHRQEDWDKALALKLSKMPAHLFRYRPPTPENLQNLRDGTIWLAAPETFNDPFDSSLALDPAQPFSTLLRKSIAGDEVDLSADIRTQLMASSDPLAALEEVFVTAVEKEGGPEQAARAEGLLTTFLAQQGNEMAARMSVGLRRGLKIACFCETGTSLPLWGYYANHHRGFCVEYPLAEFPSDDIWRHLLHPVVYAPERFTPVSLMDRMIADRNLRTPFFAILAAVHKSPDWAHEREWRIVDPTGDDSPGRAIRMPRPSALFLGARMAPEYRRDVVALAEGQNIPLREIVLSDQRFELRATPLASSKKASDH